MKKSKFNLLFESVMAETRMTPEYEIFDDYPEDETGRKCVKEYRRRDYYVLIFREFNDDGSKYFTYEIYQCDENGTISDYPIFEDNDNEFETKELAEAAAEDWIIDFDNNCYQTDYEALDGNTSEESDKK